MKKSAFPAALLLIGVALSGCPVYDSSDRSCESDFDCPYGSLCDGATLTCFIDQSSSAKACSRPLDCDNNETCNRFGSCVIGDCHFSSVGCVKGYECSPDSGVWECVKPGAETGAGGNNAGAAGAAGEASGGAPEPASSAGAGG